jgi:hypothetical protein
MNVKVAVAAVVGLLLLLLADAALAQQQMNLSTVANRTGDVSKAVAGAAFQVLSLIGFICAGVGIYKIVMAKKTNEPMGLGIAMALGGALMLALPIIINATTTSAVGKNADGLIQLDIK